MEIRRRIRCRNTVPEITDRYGLFTAVKVPFCDHVRKRTVNESVLIDLGEHVCFFDGLDYIGNNLVEIGLKIKKICDSRPVKIFQPLTRITYQDYSDFCKKNCLF